MRDTLALVSPERSWSLLIRHAARPEIPAGSFGTELSITRAGRAAAELLGQQLGSRIRRLVTSPVRRCVQTAEALRDGADSDAKMVASTMLGNPGVWIAATDAAGEAFLRLGPKGVVARQLVGDVDGMTALDTGVMRFVDLLLSAPGAPSQIDVFVSHDAVIAPLLATLLDICCLPDVWPDYLEGAFVSGRPGTLNVIWRGRERSVPRRSPWLTR